MAEVVNRNLNPDEFSEQFRPSEYGESWDDVDYNLSQDEDDSGPWIRNLTSDLGERGIHTPVQVHRGFVIDGHHRVTAARRAQVDIPYEQAPSELYEGQTSRE